MKSVNSLSGGKTSSYMAVHYPADYNVFSLVRIDAEYCKPKDESIVKYVSDKIGMDFIATAESDITLYAVRDLEQLLGKEITWVTGKSFDEVIKHRGALPNMFMRFCTTDMKIQPIFDWWINNFAPEKIWMSLGIRYDEKERGFDKKGNKKPDKPFKHIIGKHDNGNNKWAETQWRNTIYPLILNRITNYHVREWAKSTNLVFPQDSNCVGCFWKPLQQLRKNWEDEPLKMRWFSEIEQQRNRTFKKEMPFEDIKKIGLQQDFHFGTGSGCQAGFCTD
jgi:hypothetical protein